MEHTQQKAEDGALEDAQQRTNNKKGGWITFPFIIGSVMGLSLAATGWYANIVVYAIQKYNINPIASAQLLNVVNGGINFFPIIGAILADSLFGSYTLVIVSSFVSLLGAIMFIISSTISSLRPPPCMNPTQQPCNNPPSSSQYAFLYATLVISMVGFGGTRFVLASFGADQFKKPQQHRVFFNWFIFAIETTSIIGFTIIVYLQDKGLWTLSFGISAVLNVIVVALFLFGSRFYVLTLPQGSPFVSIARVVVASFRKGSKRGTIGEEEDDNDYFYSTSESKMVLEPPSSSLRFLNRAAMIKEGDHRQTTHGQILTKSWRLCTVEEVEDLKKFIKALPIWSCGILLSTIAGVASSLAVLQALAMDRTITPNFKLPASSVLVFALISASLMITLLDRVLYPLWEKFLGRTLQTLSRVGIGYFIAFLSMISFAVIEHKRLNSMLPISVLWLILPLGLLGISSSFYYPAEIAYYYQELPNSLRSTATALASLHFAVGYYLSTVFINLVHRSSSWLPDDINHGRIDKVYWTLGIIGAANFVYFLICAKLYKYSNAECKMIIRLLH